MDRVAVTNLCSVKGMESAITPPVYIHGVKNKYRYTHCVPSKRLR